MNSFSTRKREVPDDFNHVASHYDLLTGLNPGYHKHLLWSAKRMGLRPNARVLDLCCGTGASTRALVRAWPEADITGVDGSVGMLAVARRKAELARVRFLHGDAMDPASSGCAGPYDGVLMAYGIRNMSDPDLCLSRLRALLKPGGTVCFHEYSVADSRLARAVWNAVALGVIIPSGMVTSPRSGIYRYLRESVNRFDGRRAFEERLRNAGFVNVRTRPMDGWQRGVVHSFLAERA